MRILDCGCGNGLTMNYLSRLYRESCFVGIDFAWPRLKIGKDHLGLSNFICADATNMPFRDNAFDVSFTVHCLEQIPYGAKKALSELARVTKKKIILIEPDYKDADIVQKLYILGKDYTRNLESSIESLNLDYRKRRLDTYPNPFNPSGLFVIETKEEVGNDCGG